MLNARDKTKSVPQAIDKLEKELAKATSKCKDICDKISKLQ